jgi:ribonucleoside-diphosphate reductase alpha chain
MSKLPNNYYLVSRLFTSPDKHPYDTVEWVNRQALITGNNGEVVFQADNLKFPSSWSQTAVNVVASKYFRESPVLGERETDLRQLIDRVVNTLRTWGMSDGYFNTEVEADIFSDELTYILLHQKAAFNSPVWFNVGIEDEPQSSACFINSVEDTMESILELVKTEGMLFKWGSGTGTNYSVLRSSKEQISGGGKPSGPVSFLKLYDTCAGTIRSGGKLRRAARMSILNIDHPDIEEFISCKVGEEKKARALIDAGFDGSFGGEVYSSVAYQNTNISVRVTNDFMSAVLRGESWPLRAVTNRSIIESVSAKSLLRSIAQAAYTCGDPGLQFHDTINSMNTCAAGGDIVASNPCGEFNWLNDSACNLASINLLAYLHSNGNFLHESFTHTVNVMITAQDILIDRSSFPTEQIKQNSVKYRPLGLGYANLGALLMSKGFAYDSDIARTYAGVITAIMTGQAYLQSSYIARRKGTFPAYSSNRESMRDVLEKHLDAVEDIPTTDNEDASALLTVAIDVWVNALHANKIQGVRNSQTTVLAPTGTISFMMDCDTTGIEPDIALVKYKQLVGGGVLKIVNKSVEKALISLGYSEKARGSLLIDLEERGTLEDSIILSKDNLPVFDCALPVRSGGRVIPPRGHVLMMAAVQPFISGAISKTVNLPSSATVEEIEEIYIDAWKLGLKSITIYRDGCKNTQPLNVKSSTAEVSNSDSEVVDIPVPQRRRLPEDRQALTHKFSIGGHEGYLTVGLYPEGTPGELFIRMSKQGSAISGLADAFATAVSMALQYGVPLDVLINKFSYTRFEPSGWTPNKDIPLAHSITDYIFRYLKKKFLQGGEDGNGTDNAASLENPYEEVVISVPTGEPCANCGTLTQRAGSCAVCPTCGNTTGCG